MSQKRFMVSARELATFVGKFISAGVGRVWEHFHNYDQILLNICCSSAGLGFEVSFGSVLCKRNYV